MLDPTINEEEAFERLGGLIRAGVAKSYEIEAQSGGRAPAQYVYASQYRECTRRMALDVAFGHELPPFPVDVLARMRRGKEREIDIKRRLEIAGKLSFPQFEVVGGEERFELKGKSGRVVLAGRVDFSVKALSLLVRVEVKSIPPHVAAKINAPEDFERTSYWSHFPYQMLAYLLGSGSRWGGWLLDSGGLPKLIPCDLYAEGRLDKAEAFLTAAETASEAGVLYRETGDPSILPEQTKKQELCRMCPWFGNRCQPEAIEAGARVGTEPELVEAERVYWATKQAAADHEAAAETLKEWAKEDAGGLAVVGDTTIRTTRFTRTTYNVPAEVKAPYKKEVESCRSVLLRSGLPIEPSDNEG